MHHTLCESVKYLKIKFCFVENLFFLVVKALLEKSVHENFITEEKPPSENVKLATTLTPKLFKSLVFRINYCVLKSEEKKKPGKFEK